MRVRFIHFAKNILLNILKQIDIRYPNIMQAIIEDPFSYLKRANGAIYLEFPSRCDQDAALSNTILNIVERIIEPHTELSAVAEVLNFPNDNKEKINLLYLAAWIENIDTTELLIENGAVFDIHVKYKDKFGRILGGTALNAATINGHVEIGKRLLKDGAKEGNFTIIVKKAAEIDSNLWVSLRKIFYNQDISPIQDYIREKFQVQLDSTEGEQPVTLSR